MIAKGFVHALLLNTLRPRQDGRHFPDYIFKCIFLNENVLISIKIPLKFVRNGPINKIPALVQIMAWRLPGDKPLSEPLMVSLPMHICITRPQWVNKKYQIFRILILVAKMLFLLTKSETGLCQDIKQIDISRYLGRYCMQTQSIMIKVDCFLEHTFSSNIIISLIPIADW